MASTIVTKNSSTASAVPVSGDLTQGELAVNVTDKRLFTKNSGGTVVELGINPSSLTMSGGTANGVAYLNGSKVVTTGTALTFDGTNLAGTGSMGTTIAGKTAQFNAAGGSIYASFADGTKTWRFGVGIQSAGTVSLYNSTDAVTAYTVDATGNFGIGTISPSTKLDVAGVIRVNEDGAGTKVLQIRSNYAGVDPAINVTTNNSLLLMTNNTIQATLSATGNLGLGVTPSAWGSARKAFQLNSGSVYATTSGDTVGVAQNAYNDGTSWKYVSNGYASSYYHNSGGHYFNIAASGTAGTAITFTQAMTLDASGKLGIGTTSPGSQLTVIGSAAKLYVDLSGDNYYDAANHVFRNFAGTERARIDTSGNLLVGTTSGSFHRFHKSSSGDFAVQSANTSATTPYGHVITFTAAAPNDATSMFLRCDDTGVTGRIQLRSNGGIANYSANNVNLSDRREKTNFAPAGEYLSKICAIPVQTYKYIDQHDDELTLGVVAQDVQEVAPELVTESNWGTEEEPKMRLSIYQTDLQYALMKCIQEQQALIQTLTERITALEGK